MLLCFLLLSTPAWGAESPWLADLTWPEVKARMDAGAAVIIPTAGTEQNGPHIVLGKHHRILEYTAPRIAKETGALLAPIVDYVPEEGHMKFPGTISMEEDTFAALLEDTVRSLQRHGFTRIYFLGEHGASQPVQKKLAEKLTRKGLRVVNLDRYYTEANGQEAWLQQQKLPVTEGKAHAGFFDASEMMAAAPEGLRKKEFKPFTQADFEATGAKGSPMLAKKEYGKQLLELKINAAVEQIKNDRTQAP